MADLNSDQLAGLAEQYFEGVDNMDWDAVRQTLTEDCSIEIRSHGVVHTGRDQGVKHMFEGLTVIRKSGMEDFAMSVMLKGSLSPLNSRY